MINNTALIFCPLLLLFIFLFTELSSVVSMKQVAIVTGANKGIGFEIAKRLGDLNVKTIIASRNPNYGRQAVNYIQSQGYDSEFRQLDVTDRDSIYNFASSLEKDYESIDILVNNAGVYEGPARSTIYTNYFGLTWVTDAVLPLLKRAPHPRIVNVASELGHLSAIPSTSLRRKFASETLTIDELNDMMEESASRIENRSHAPEWPSDPYNASKVGVIAYTKILARTEPDISINACCPGYCATDMTGNRGDKTAEEGSDTPVYLAMLPVGSRSGGFFANRREIKW
jgi:carbonyl reductase 1